MKMKKVERAKKIEIRINIQRFILYHKRRIPLLKKLVKEKKYGRLIYQISFLGFESLSKILYLEDNSPRNRFIRFLSIAIGKDDSTQLWHFWRNPLIHGGFVTVWSALEAWDEEDIGFISFPEIDSIRSSVEYTPETIIAIYENLIDHVDNFFKKTNTKKKTLHIK